MRFNIVAIRVTAMLKGIASSISIAAILRQYKHWNKDCGNAMPRCCSIVATQFLWQGLPVVPLGGSLCGGAVSCCWKGR